MKLIYFSSLTSHYLMAKYFHKLSKIFTQFLKEMGFMCVCVCVCVVLYWKNLIYSTLHVKRFFELLKCCCLKCQSNINCATFLIRICTVLASLALHKRCVPYESCTKQIQSEQIHSNIGCAFHILFPDLIFISLYKRTVWTVLNLKTLQGIIFSSYNMYRVNTKIPF